MKSLIARSYFIGFIIISSFLLQAQKPHQQISFTDKYGREIMSVNDEKFEYEFSSLLESSLPDIKMEVAKQTGGSSTYCDPIWKQGIMGTCIGENSMVTADIDNDGLLEIIITGGSGFGGGNFWYVMEYNNTTQNYEQVWISDYFDSYDDKISTISAFDTDNDNIYEIFLGYSSGNIDVYDGVSLQKVDEINSSINDPVNRIIFEDVDNLGQFDIVYCTDYNTWIHSASDYQFKTMIDYGGDDMKCGDVDTDPENEIVYSNGDVIQVNGQTVEFKWDFNGEETYEGYVELTDTDADGMKEIVFARYWYNIVIYDADIQSPKYEIESDLDIDALTIADVDGDGVNEILYGDGQWGSIYCHRAQNGALIWSIHNPEHGTTNIDVADVDNDGELEVIWGAGCSSTGSDHLFVHNVESQDFEWKSVHIDGPFYAVEVGDVNDDGREEIVTISFESESGYDAGILSVFNTEDHELLWQSDGNFLYGCWTGIHTIEIEDIDGDNQTEIIVAAGVTYNGKIWVINGSTYEIESEHEYFSEDISEFYAFDIGDVDNDGSLDYAAADESHVYVINPTDYSVKWKSVSLGYGKPKALFIDNVNSNPNKDIVVCKNKIYIMDGITHQQWETYESNYTHFDIYDLDQDGQNDIIAATSSGDIIKIDGETHQYEYLLSDFSQPIAGIKMADLVGDEQPEIVFTSEGYVYFYKIGENMMATNSFGTMAGAYDGLFISDYDNNGKKEIIVGTNYLTIELNDDCYECIDFSIEVVGQNLTCNEGDDGVVEVLTNGGQEPYTYDWDFGGTEAIEVGLSPGIYSVTVTDNRGCSQTGEVSIIQSSLHTYYKSTNVGCTGVNNGTAEINIINGNPPYNYDWSTGETSPKITGLSAGTYNVSITDSKNCFNEYSVSIYQDSVSLIMNSQNISCFGSQDGYITAWINSGHPPFYIDWSNGETTLENYNLSEGAYSLTVTDSLQCINTQEVYIVEPSEILLTGSSTPDKPQTPDIHEGSATVVAEGGNPPYYYEWNDPYHQTSSTATNLAEGNYTVTVSDRNGCYQITTVTVESATAISEINTLSKVLIYPNPAKDKVYLEVNFKNRQDLEVKITDQMGKLVINQIFNDLTTEKISVNIAGLDQGVYSVVLSNEKETTVERLIIFK